MAETAAPKATADDPECSTLLANSHALNNISSVHLGNNPARSNTAVVHAGGNGKSRNQDPVVQSTNKLEIRKRDDHEIASNNVRESIEEVQCVLTGWAVHRRGFYAGLLP